MSKKPVAPPAGRRAQTSRFPVSLIVIGAVVALAVIAFAIVFFSQKSTPATATPAVAVQPLAADITPKEAATMRDAGAFVLDVRELSEWTTGHIAGATLIPLGQLESRVNELPKDKDIVVICRTGVRSAQARVTLLNAGFQRVTSVAGGINAWKSNGLPTVTGN